MADQMKTSEQTPPFKMPQLDRVSDDDLRGAAVQWALVLLHAERHGGGTALRNAVVENLEPITEAIIKAVRKEA